MQMSLPEADATQELSHEVNRRGVAKIRRRHPRKVYSCEPCRDSKLRCDRQFPCANCRRRELTASCVYRNAERVVRAGQLVEQHTPSVLQETAAETPGQISTSNLAPPLSPPSDVAQDTSGQLSDRGNEESILNNWDHMLQRPSPDVHHLVSGPSPSELSLSLGLTVPTEVLLAQIPSIECCDYLISRYFMHLSALFDILHGPTFQDQYARFLRDRNSVSLSWLAVLFVVCSMGLNTVDFDDPVIAQWLAERQSGQIQDPAALSRSFRGMALNCLFQDEFLVRHDLNSLEALLILIYSVCHNEGVERSWTLLGMALNMAIALKCNKKSILSDTVIQERRQRCWAGIQLLHTYQGILFRDVDISHLLKLETNLPVESNISGSRREPSIWSTDGHDDRWLMRFKLRLFRLSTELCCHMSKPTPIYDASLIRLEKQISDEQDQWDKTFLVNGIPSVLDTASYAHWCILQTYAHQLYLLIHRPFHRSRSPHFRPESRNMCLKSGRALLDLHAKFYHLPRLRYYRWLVRGMTSFNALQGAVALTSCILDAPVDASSAADCEELDMMIVRLQGLRDSSPICKKAYPVACNLQTYLRSRFNAPTTEMCMDFIPEDWVDYDWFNFDTHNIVS